MLEAMTLVSAARTLARPGEAGLGRDRPRVPPMHQAADWLGRVSNRAQ